MSYFHTGIRTIIGAEAFHGPVRDGKEWGHLAMVIRLNCFWSAFFAHSDKFMESIDKKFSLSSGILIAPKYHLKIGNTCSTSIDLRQNYRVKPHEQLVLVSLTGYPASTPSLSTSWSRTTL